MDTAVTMADAIENQIITLMIADSNFDTVKVFDTEERAVVMVSDYTLMVISITGQDEILQLQGETGPESGLIKYAYTGYISAEARAIDRPRVGSDRVAKRGSKGDLRNLLDAATRLLELYPRLDNFVFGGETVRDVTRTSKEYMLSDRNSNLFNRGFFGISIETHKERAS